MERVGIVDLGSNTARLVVYAFEPGKHFRLQDEIRELIRLGSGLWRDGRLNREALDRAVAVLGLYSDFARASGLGRLTVYATSALRDAENRSAFFEQVEPLDLDIQVLSGEDEARLGVLAVANSFDFEDAWVMDLGGGSAQLSRMEGRQADACTSVPLGAVRLTETHLRSDPPAAKEVAALEETVEQELAGIAEQIRSDGRDLVAMGGTIRNLAKAAKVRQGYSYDLLHGYFLRRDALEELTGRLLAMPAKKRARVRGIHPDRADIILAGALVYRWLLRRSGRGGFWIAGQGVREGAFYRHFLPPPHLLPDVRKFSVRNLFRHYPQPKSHTRRVRRLALALFDALAPLHGWGGRERELLAAAARLHDIGTAVNYYDHHKHGAYLVESMALPGFSHREQALLALLVRYHRKGTPKPGPVKSLLAGGDLERLSGLSLCLRLAESCERSRAGRVEGFEVAIGKKRVTVTLLANESPHVELWEARKHQALFHRAFGRSLRLEAVVKPS